MKFNTPNSGFVKSDQALGGVGLSIKASPKAIRTMIDTLYRYKEEAVARELISNGRDAHHMRDAKLAPSMQSSHYQSLSTARLYTENMSTVDWYAPRGKPMEIHVPTENEPYFELKDFGVGLPLDKIMGEIALDAEGDYIRGENGKVVWMGGMYVRLFDSPKDEDNTQIGGFGLGAKSPSTIADSYTVETRFNGEKYIIFVYEDRNRIPTADLITCTPDGLPQPIPMAEGEFNGMTVRVPVSIDRIVKFKRALAKVLRFVDTPYVFTNVAITVEKPSFTQQFGQTHMTSNGSGNHYAVQGGVVYPIDMNMLSIDVSEVFKDVSCDTYTFFPIGSINMQPSREDLEYDKHTIEVLEDYLGAAAVQIKDYLKNYRVGASLADRIRTFEHLKKLFDITLLTANLRADALVDTERYINISDVIANSFGIEGGAGNRDYLWFGTSVDIMRRGMFEPKMFTMSRSRSERIHGKHLMPNVASGTTNTFVIQGQRAPLVGCAGLANHLRDKHKEKFGSSFSQLNAWLTPCSITSELRRDFVRHVKKITVPEVKAVVMVEHMAGKLEPHELNLFKAKTIQQFEAEYPQEGEAARKYDEWMDSVYTAIANKRVATIVSSKATEYELFEHLKTIFDKYEADVYHSDQLETDPNDEITFERIQNLKGIAFIGSKVRPMSGEGFFKIIEQARETGQRIPFVFLRGHDLHEDSHHPDPDLRRKMMQPSSIYSEYDRLRDLGYIQGIEVYHDTIIGVRITGRKFFEEHAELFVHVPDMFADLVNEETLTDNMVNKAVRNVYRPLQNIIPTKGEFLKFNAFMRDINRIYPNTFEDWMLQVHKFMFSNRYQFLTYSMTYDISEYGVCINNLLSKHQRVRKAMHDVTRMREFWDEFVERLRQVKRHFGLDYVGELNAEGYQNVLRKHERDTMYNMLALKPRDLERKLEEKWYREHGITCRGNRMPAVCRALKELFYDEASGTYPTLGEEYHFTITMCRQVPVEVIDELYVSLCIYERDEVDPELLRHFYVEPVVPSEGDVIIEPETEQCQE